MCAPLWNRDVVIGVLYVDNPHTAQLSAADLDILQALVAQQSRSNNRWLSARIVEETRQRELLQRFTRPRWSTGFWRPARAMPRSSSKSVTSRSCSPASSASSRVAYGAVGRRAPSNQCLGEMSEAASPKKHAGQVHR
jgi:hypothetical protein